MDNLIREVTELTNVWYTLIGPDHHKDRDCHWYIETRWSYGSPPKYTVWHRGYILDEINENWCTYEQALGRLKEILLREIKEYENDSKEDNDL